jgi:hypothetical protein
VTLSFILDGAVAILLVATIFYCILLNRRLAALRRNEDELRNAVASFNEAAARAEAGVSWLKKTGEEIGDALKDQIEEAGALCDDLAFVTERGEKLVDRLSESISAQRGAPRPGHTAAAEAPGEGPYELSRAERELLDALDRHATG